MSSRILLLAILGACVPKPVPPATAVTAPATPAPAMTPVPATPVAATPVPADSSATSGSAAATPAPAPPPSDSVASRVNDAAAMLTTADPSRAQRALELLQAQRDAHPEVAAIHYNIGVAYQVLGQEAEARKAWTRATEVDPTFAKAWINLGVLSERAGRADIALASFQSGERYAPMNVDLRVATISVLRQLKRYPDAVAEAKTALGINSKAIPVYTELAMVYLDTSQYDLAKFTLQKALADIDGAKSNARLYAVLGEVYYRLGFSGDAIATFQRSLELDAFQLPALLYLAGYYMDNRAWSDATPLLERAAGVEPSDAGIQLNLGISYRGEGRFEDAKKAYVTALTLAPSNPEPHRNLAVLYGDYMKAYDAALQSIEDYRRAGGGPPEELDAWVASIKKEQKRIEKENERKKRDEDERRKQDEVVPASDPTAPGGAGAAPPPDGGTTAPAGTASPTDATPAPAPAGTAMPADAGTPAPTGTTAPADATPAPAPASTPAPAPAPAPTGSPPPDDGTTPPDNPWGG